MTQVETGMVSGLHHRHLNSRRYSIVECVRLHQLGRSGFDSRSYVRLIRFVLSSRLAGGANLPFRCKGLSRLSEEQKDSVQLREMALWYVLREYYQKTSVGPQKDMNGGESISTHLRPQNVRIGLGMSPDVSGNRARTTPEGKRWQKSSLNVKIGVSSESRHSTARAQAHNYRSPT